MQLANKKLWLKTKIKERSNNNMIYNNNRELPWDNKIFISGTVVEDAKLVPMTNTSLVGFSVRQTDKIGDRKREHYHNVIFFTKKAETAKQLTKGTEVFIAGKLEYKSFEDSSGVKRTKAQINAYMIDFASGTPMNIEDEF